MHKNFYLESDEILKPLYLSDTSTYISSNVIYISGENKSLVLEVNLDDLTSHGVP